ncbi:patatin-like phospholipase family protein [Rhodococcus sp. BS-15]|mgnify:CR=1 FL=1|uniref:patatin-like phospholipase family protein n=1 Tax=Rhodococcus sp. BS-15 TaxID=1304954 RepID=UPI000B2F2BAE|nr:patatin-like phospholipase family protein [Rhodococcus sp. BS-15]
MNNPSTALVLGCGAAVGAAWTVGALVSIRDELGIDPTDADLIIGTSAGAQYGVMLSAGIGVDDLVALQRGHPTHPALTGHLSGEPAAVPRIPFGIPSHLRRVVRSDLPTLARTSALLPDGTLTPHWLHRLAHLLAPRDWVDHRKLRLVAMDAATGQRVVFGAPDSPAATLAQALHASWAVPGMIRPATIDGRQYLDGGTWSTASADLAAGYDRVIVITPMASLRHVARTGAGHIEHAVLRNPMTAGLCAELATLHGSTQLAVFTPGTEDLAAMGPNFLDPRRRKAALDTALRTTAVTARSIQRRWNAGRTDSGNERTG